MIRTTNAINIDIRARFNQALKNIRDYGIIIYNVSPQNWDNEHVFRSKYLCTMTGKRSPFEEVGRLEDGTVLITVVGGYDESVEQFFNYRFLASDGAEFLNIINYKGYITIDEILSVTIKYLEQKYREDIKKSIIKEVASV